MNIIDVLEAKRLDMSLSDQEFAKQLGISKGFWCLLKQGKKRPGRKLILCALQRFPEITGNAEQLEIFLR